MGPAVCPDRVIPAQPDPPRCGRGHQWWRLGWGVGLTLLVAGGGLTTGNVGATQRSGPVLIGALTESWGPTPHVIGLRDGLRALGHREHEQFAIGVRFTQGDRTALPTAARDLVQQGVHVLFTMQESATQAAQAATTRIPIVFQSVGDPVGLKMVQSFARPGGNITGVANLEAELGPKRLEVFRELIPGLTRVLFVYDETNAHAVAEARSYREAARRLGIALVERPVRNQDGAQAALDQVRKGEAHGILSPRFLASNIPGFVMEAGTRVGIPTMFDTPFYVEQGGLASYGQDLYESGRQAARLVDKIIKGTSPGSIPVEVNTKLELVINLKVARTLGLAIAPEVLYRADRVLR